jgi:hypothetical protein
MLHQRAENEERTRSTSQISQWKVGLLREAKITESGGMLPLKKQINVYMVARMVPITRSPPSTFSAS